MPHCAPAPGTTACATGSSRGPGLSAERCFRPDAPTGSAGRVGPSWPKRERSCRATATERAAVAELVRAARARGQDITGPDGLLKSITATVLETALEEEMTDHLGHAKHQAPAGGAGSVRNGTRAKTVVTEAAGRVSIEVPRDRAGTFEPVIVKKRQRRLWDVDAVAIS